MSFPYYAANSLYIARIFQDSLVHAINKMPGERGSIAGVIINVYASPDLHHGARSISRSASLGPARWRSRRWPWWVRGRTRWILWRSRRLQCWTHWRRSLRWRPFFPRDAFRLFSLGSFKRISSRHLLAQRIPQSPYSQLWLPQQLLRAGLQRRLLSRVG